MPLYLVRKGAEMPLVDACVVRAEPRRGLARLADQARRLFGADSRVTVTAVGGKPWQHEICLDDRGAWEKFTTDEKMKAAYTKVLKTAAEYGWESVIVPVMTSEPDCLIGETHMNQAMTAIRTVLDAHEDMCVWLVVPEDAVLTNDDKLRAGVDRFLQENLKPETGIDFGNSYSAGLKWLDEGRQQLRMLDEDASYSRSLHLAAMEKREILHDLLLSVEYERVVRSASDGTSRCFCARPNELQTELYESRRRIDKWRRHLHQIENDLAMRDQQQIAEQIRNELEEEERVFKRLRKAAELWDAVAGPDKLRPSAIADDGAGHEAEELPTDLTALAEQRARRLSVLHDRIRDQVECVDRQVRQAEKAQLLACSEPPAQTMHRPPKTYGAMSRELDELLNQLDESFSITLQRLIGERKMTNPECYNRANVTKQVFSKICNVENYKPSKQTVLAFCIVLKLDWEKSLDLLAKAEHGMSRSNRSDVIVEYCIVNGVFDLDTVNGLLFDRGLPQLGGSVREGNAA